MKNSKRKDQSEIMSEQHTEHPSPELDQENDERLAKQNRDKGRECTYSHLSVYEMLLAAYGHSLSDCTLSGLQK